VIRHALVRKAIVFPTFLSMGQWFTLDSTGPRKSNVASSPLFLEFEMATIDPIGCLLGRCRLGVKHDGLVGLVRDALRGRMFTVMSMPSPLRRVGSGNALSDGGIMDKMIENVIGPVQLFAGPIGPLQLGSW